MTRPARVIGSVIVTVGLTTLLGYGLPATPPPWAEAARIVAAATVVLLALRKPALEQTRVFLLAIAFMVWTMATTAAFGRLTLGLLFATLSALALMLLATKRSRGADAVGLGFLVFSIATVVLTAYSFQSPSVGLDGNARYFVGGKNALAMNLLPLVFLIHARWHPQRRSLRLTRMAVLLTACITVIAGGSGTGTVMVLAYAAFVVARGRIGRHWWWWFASVPVVHFALLSGWLLDASPWARDFVESGLGKSSDFTRRVYTWDVAWAHVSMNPFGEGRGYSFLADRFADLSETHNLMLEALVTGGWPGLVLLLLLVAAIMRACAQRGDRAGVYFIWVACLVGTMESYTYHFAFWLLLGLALANPVETIDMRQNAARESEAAIPR